MKPYRAIINGIELALVAITGGAGTYALFSSSVYEGLRNYGEAHNMEFMPYLHLIIWGVLTAYGIISIVLNNRGSGVFIWLAAILMLPSLLAQNNIDWPHIFGWDVKLTTTLGFSGTLAAGVIIITGYVIFQFLRQFKQTGQSLAERKADPADIEKINSFTTSSLFLTICGALAITVAVAFLAQGIESISVGLMKIMPWNIVLTGIFCLLLIAFYLYWFFARRRVKVQPPADKPGNNQV